jgi:hypothetical protein
MVEEVNVKGFIRHDSRRCNLGTHSNRGPTDYMCPVYLELRRSRLRAQMKMTRYIERMRHGR